MVQYIVTGAAGHLGSTVLRLLLKEKRSVKGLILPYETPELEGVEYVKGDILRAETLTPFFSGCDDQEIVVIHTAGIVDISGKLTDSLHQVNVEGTRNILACCRNFKVSKFVYVSSVHAIPETSTYIKEIQHFSPDCVAGGYAKTKAEATQIVLDAVQEGVPAVVVHPSGIIGPYDNGKNHLVQMVQDYMSGKLPVCVPGGYDVVDVRDVAKGCLLAAERGKIGECYILSGSYQQIQDILKLVGHLCGLDAPIMVPLLAARFAEPFLSFGARIQGRRPLYTRYSLDTINTKARFCSQKAHNELNYQARPISTTICDTVHWLLHQDPRHDYLEE